MQDLHKNFHNMSISCYTKPPEKTFIVCREDARGVAGVASATPNLGLYSIN